MDADDEWGGWTAVELGVLMIGEGDAWVAKDDFRGNREIGVRFIVPGGDLWITDLP